MPRAEGNELVSKKKKGYEIVSKNKEGKEIVSKKEEGNEIVSKKKEGNEIVEAVGGAFERKVQLVDVDQYLSSQPFLET